MADELAAVRDFLEGVCKNRHEHTGRAVNGLRKQVEENSDDIQAVRERLAEQFGAQNGGDGTVGRMHTDILELRKQVTEVADAHNRRITKLEHIYARILIVCGGAVGGATLLWRLIERLIT